MHIIARLFKGKVFTNAVTFQWSLGCIILLFSFVIFTLSWAGILYFFLGGEVFILWLELLLAFKLPLFLGG